MIVSDVYKFCGGRQFYTRLQRRLAALALAELRVLFVVALPIRCTRWDSARRHWNGNSDLPIDRGIRNKGRDPSF